MAQKAIYGRARGVYEYNDGEATQQVVLGYLVLVWNTTVRLHLSTSPWCCGSVNCYYLIILGT